MIFGSDSGSVSNSGIGGANDRDDNPCPSTNQHSLWLSVDPSELRIDLVTTVKCQTNSEHIVAEYNECGAVYEHGKPDAGGSDEVLSTTMDSEASKNQLDAVRGHRR